MPWGTIFLGATIASILGIGVVLLIAHQLAIPVVVWLVVSSILCQIVFAHFGIFGYPSRSP